MRIIGLFSLLAVLLAAPAAHALKVYNQTGDRNEKVAQLVRVYFTAPECAVTVSHECGEILNTCSHTRIPYNQNKSYTFPEGTTQRRIQVCYTDQAPKILGAGAGAGAEFCYVEGNNVRCE